MRIDSLLGVAVVREPDGALQALHAGETSRAGRFRVVRLFADHVEIEVAAEGSKQPSRFWMALAAQGEPSRILPVSRQAPPSAPIPQSAAMTDSLPGPGH